jgi:hypothetical protein
MIRDEDFRRPANDGGGSNLLTPAAVLIGSLFIAGAIVYAAHLLVGAFGTGAGAFRMAPVVWTGGGGGGGPVPQSGVAITRDTPLKVGSKVLAPDGPGWYRATVLALDGEDVVRIRYTGWGPQFDRDFTRDQLQKDTSAGQ